MEVQNRSTESLSGIYVPLSTNPIDAIPTDHPVTGTAGIPPEP